MLKDYIVISNKAETVSRISLEKLGFSTKRNDAKTIGQFGSGIKYAPIAALRNGLEWFFTGNDKNGPFTLEYIVQEEDGVECIAYKYGDQIKSSSFTLEAGVMSWEDPFQILREPIANAMDGATMNEDGWYNIFVITVDTDDPESMKKLEPREGIFSVYITASPNLMKVVNNYDAYFSVKREVLFDNHFGKLLDKFDNTSRFYTLNVLVKHDETSNSIFDYQFDSLELNEERSVKSLWDLDYNVSKMICSVTNPDIAEEYISEFVGAKAEDSGIWELNRLASQNFKYHGSDVSHEVWQKTWNNLYTEKAIMLNGEQNSDSLRMAVISRGYQPIVVANKTAYNILSSMEIKSLFDILGEQIDYEIDDDISMYPRLLEAIEIASHFEQGLNLLREEIGVFESKKEGIVGMCVTIGDNKKRIIIEKYHAKNGTIQELVGTLIHEFDHYSTNVGDSSDMIGREFRNIADTRIGGLMVEHYKQDILEKKFGGAYIAISKMSSVSNLNYNSEYSEILGKTILGIGGLNFIIECSKTAIEKSGTCFIDKSGKYLYVPINGEFEIVKEIN
jgi:hypothetical protein